MLWSGHAAWLSTEAVLDAVSSAWRSAVHTAAAAADALCRWLLPQLWDEVSGAAAAASDPRAELLLGQALLWALVAALLFYLQSWLQVILCTWRPFEFASAVVK